jgi:ElaB/YqjD/DUF883 family membrane-anchored ribosome-binding protein
VLGRLHLGAVDIVGCAYFFWRDVGSPPRNFLASDRVSECGSAIAPRATKLSEITVFRTRTRKAAQDLAYDELIRDVETRLRRIYETAGSEGAAASREVNDFISGATAMLADRLRERAEGFARNAADQASRASQDAASRLTDEIDRHPIAALGLALGIGFLLGMASRRG